MLDLEHRLGVHSDLLEVPTTSDDQDLTKDLDGLYHYLDVDTSTPPQRAQGENIDYFMDDGIFKMLDQHVHHYNRHHETARAAYAAAAAEAAHDYPDAAHEANDDDIFSLLPAY